MPAAGSGSGSAAHTRALRPGCAWRACLRAKTLAQFDFAFQPSIDERQMRELATLRFVSEASNVILLGPPGVGKTHLAIALAVEAIAGRAQRLLRHRP